VTGERIRDKIAASKQKGMWMGGTVTLGYDVRDHRRGQGGLASWRPEEWHQPDRSRPEKV
jgi:hypothetical protein